MLSSAKTKAENLSLDTLLPAGTIAPYDGVLTSEMNYRLFAQCMDKKFNFEADYVTTKQNDMWKNIGIGFLAGLAAVLVYEHRPL
jgi:hypothetical protein